MKIFIHYKDKKHGHQILDAWYSYKQHQNRDDNYKSTIQCIWPDKSTADLTILCCSIEQPATQAEIQEFDLVLICNGCGESLDVFNPVCKELVLKYSNVYIIANAYIDNSHPLDEKVIWIPHNFITCRKYWTEHFYPQYFDIQEFKLLKRTNLISWINGANRVNRHYFSELLSDRVPSVVNYSRPTNLLLKLLDCQFETYEDSDFREWINERYHNLTTPYYDDYYCNSPSIGIDNKFGLVPPGYFLMPLYYENYCVVFPETSWTNNQLCLTEKALKCFYAGSLPMPVAGSNINHLYNQLGFYTAWNLLPNKLQHFDKETNHEKRYSLLVDAIAWLVQNPEVFYSDQFKQLVQHNFVNFLTNDCEAKMIEKIDRVMKNSIDID